MDKDKLRGLLQKEIDKGTSARKLSKDIGVSPQTLNNYLEKDNKVTPGVETLKKIAKHFEIPISYFFDEEKTLPPPTTSESGTLRNLENRITIIEEVLSRQVGEHRRRWYDKKITVEN